MRSRVLIPNPKSLKGISQIRSIRVLGKQPEHINEDDAQEIHAYRKYLDMSVRDIALIFKRSSETVHRILKKPVSLPPKEVLIEQRK